ncbi:MAG: tRNA (adenosine(37)-N6)-threonylcarbamoyltransferase complex transferase subunit TsaD [bacterium]|nr:tRNA (adenosine(37)-N6)-threonylcarbamoyltransferase complex transferase subunit TsaD [bacterium]
MRILAIETSCDDTGIAILEASGRPTSAKFKVLSNIVSSQQIHANYGGVFPIMAKREHQTNLVPVLMQALKLAKLANPKPKILNPKQIQALKKILEKESNLFEYTKEFLEKYEKPDVDMIAVTHGPGLEPCLWVGVNFAKALSYFWNIPVVPVNHIEAHILVNFLEQPKIEFPAVSLIVSGGHTQLILVKKIGSYKIIGETKDDAAGECFDKAARILGLGYPGGPIISEIASRANNAPKTFTLPRPMMHSKDYDFSFSGLKTAVLYKLRDTKPEITKSESFIQEMCVQVQQAIIDVLIKKTINAAKDFKAKTIILGGGVSANQELKKQFAQKSEIPVIFPEPKLSTDNGLMIAVTGYFNRTKKIGWQRLSVHPNLRVEK